MFSKKIFSDRLLTLRKKAKLSQTQMGEIAGISQFAISKIEKGERAVSIEVLFALANYFKVPVDYLIGQGLYGKEDIIEQHFSEIIKISKDWFSGYFNDSFWDMLSAVDIITKIQILSDLYKDISIDTDGTLVLYPNIPKKEEK